MQDAEHENHEMSSMQIFNCGPAELGMSSNIEYA